MSLSLAGATPAIAAEEGGSPPASKIEPGSQAGMERAVNGGDAERGAASKTPDPRAKKAAKKKSKKAKHEAADTAGAGGSSDRSR
ncbi:MAG TPA: hypothetical protein VFP65_29570 [Anaeromyxobacteraceae bacterium]|nr:hypothetical protein [Anaeromyxobacteraceae bacterium]